MLVTILIILLSIKLQLQTIHKCTQINEKQGNQQQIQKTMGEVIFQ